MPCSMLLCLLSFILTYCFYSAGKVLTHDEDHSRSRCIFITWQPGNFYTVALMDDLSKTGCICFERIRRMVCTRSSSVNGFCRTSFTLDRWSRVHRLLPFIAVSMMIGMSCVSLFLLRASAMTCVGIRAPSDRPDRIRIGGKGHESARGQLSGYRRRSAVRRD